MEADEAQVHEAVANVSDRNVGEGRTALPEDEVARLESLVETTLERYGYR